MTGSYRAAGGGPCASDAGFSLVELALVLVIVGALAWGATQLGDGLTQSAGNASAEMNMTTIENALDAYRRQNMRLPCPADASLAPSDPNYGVEALSADPMVLCALPLLGTHAVRGALPAVTLGLAPALMFDVWGGRLAYLVDRRLTADRAFELFDMFDVTMGDIVVRDAAGSDRTTRAVYALLSAGPNQYGATNRAGLVLNAAKMSAAEAENADLTPAGIAAPNNIVVQALPAPAFDDVVLYKFRVQMKD